MSWAASGRPWPSKSPRGAKGRNRKGREAKGAEKGCGEVVCDFLAPGGEIHLALRGKCLGIPTLSGECAGTRDHDVGFLCFSFAVWRVGRVRNPTWGGSKVTKCEKRSMRKVASKTIPPPAARRSLTTRFHLFLLLSLVFPLSPFPSLPFATFCRQ